METQVYTASKARSNRPGWSISFRHPRRRDARGRWGLKIRRGLGTSDEVLADAMVASMNEILADSTWWTAAKRKEAEVRFVHDAVVAAFYDEIEAGQEDTDAIRRDIIDLPGKNEGYSRVMCVGTTGAGKSSLLSQVCGLDPVADRFPSTAPGKTTIADIECIQAPGSYEAAVTFFSEFQTQASIEECVLRAAFAVLENASREKVAERLLSHRDQKFRLNYIIGSLAAGGHTEDSEEISFDDDADDDEPGEDRDSVSADERESIRVRLNGFVDRVESIARAALAGLTSELGVDPNAAGPDRDAARELIEENFEQRLVDDEQFHDLVQDILDDVRTRFDLVPSGTLHRAASSWPRVWHFKSDDRADFLRQVRWFSDNHWTRFGKLLTPVVDGIRLRGPFFPDQADTNSRLVLIDGQGLGHTPDSSASVTTRVTQRFADIDVIQLVDNAKQPMQAAPLAVIRAVASSGHHRKLAIAFTHFDQIKGQSLQGFAERRAHVMASVLNSLGSLRDVLGASVVKSVEHGLDTRCFMLGGLDRPFGKLPARAGNYMKAQIAQLTAFCESAILPAVVADTRPVYDPTGIGFAVQEAVAKFQGPWLARLGLGSYEGFSKEHWSRVKALNRRVAGDLDIEYDTLKPVADLVMHLRESVSLFLNKPTGWTKKPQDEQEEQEIIARTRQLVNASLHELALRRLVREHMSEWRSAYDSLFGTGSTRLRAAAIRDIYGNAAPLPANPMTTMSEGFLAEIRRLVGSAIEANGGVLRLTEAA